MKEQTAELLHDLSKNRSLFVVSCQFGEILRQNGLEFPLSPHWDGSSGSIRILKRHIVRTILTVTFCSQYVLHQVQHRSARAGKRKRRDLLGICVEQSAFS